MKGWNIDCLWYSFVLMNVAVLNCHAEVISHL